MRPFAPDDQAFIDHLYATSRADLQRASNDAVLVGLLVRQQQHIQMVGIQQNFPNAQQWIILKTREPIGRLVIDTTDTDVRLIDIVLLPKAQGHGVGKAALDAVQCFARQKGLSMSLSVSKTNTAAKKLYTSMGFFVNASDDMFDHMHWFNSCA